MNSSEANAAAAPIGERCNLLAVLLKAKLLDGAVADKYSHRRPRQP